MSKRAIGTGWLVARRCVAALGVFAVAIVAIWAYCEHENSKQVPAATDAQLRVGFANARGWVLRNRAAVLAQNNFMLWLFVREAGRLSGDSQLLALADDYQRQSVDGVVRFFFDRTGVEAAYDSHISLPDGWQPYQRLFAYGATCNIQLSTDVMVQSMLSPSVCEQRLAGVRNPWCRTHQLMGLRLVQKNRCLPDEETRPTLEHVQAGILAELQWDFRVEDAYLQKVWTLIESGRRDQIKAVWIHRILAAQQADGGWTAAHIILPLPAGRALYWEGSLVPHLGRPPQTDFHATAQGLYLLALLLHRDRAS